MQPRVEALERRDTPSTTTGRGMVVVQGTESRDVVIVQADASNDRLVVSFNGELSVTPLSATQAVVADLGGDNDYFGYTGPQSGRADHNLRLIVSCGGGRDEVFLHAGCASAVLFGDGGSDLLTAWPNYRGQVYATGGAGDDTLNGGRGDDGLFGGRGDDAVSGNGGDDVLQGGAGDDEIYATVGSDTVDGGSGADLIYVNAAASVFPGGPRDRVILV